MCSGQQCINTAGDFRCECLPNFTVHSKRHCILANTTINPYHVMLYSAGSRVYFLRWSKPFSGPPFVHEEYELAKFQNFPVVFDVNLEDNYYVASGHAGQFFIDRLLKDRPLGLEGLKLPNVLVKQNFTKIKSLCLDWINHLIYFINRSKIEVIKITKPDIVFTLVDNLVSPEDIEVNPIDSWLVWSDSNAKNPTIERISLDGTSRQVLVEGELRKPTGLTIDFLTSRIFWLDSNSINSILFDGTDRRQVIQSRSRIHHPIDLDIFDHDIFWSDDNDDLKGVFTMDKFALSETTYQLVSRPRVSRVLTLEQFKQPRNGRKACDSKCPYLCLPDQPSHCICPEGYTFWDAECRNFTGRWKTI